MNARAALRFALALAAAAAIERTAAATEDIDDPKLTRRLGTRVSVPGQPAAVAPAFGPAPAPAPGPAYAPAVPVARPGEAATPGAVPPEESLTGGPVRAPAGNTTPHVKLGFRRFDFVRIGATTPGSTSGAPASEPFNSIGLDIYPVSSLVRFGLTTQYGWQSGTFSTSGDYFVAQSFSLGVQFQRRPLMPFAEAFGGGGYMRRLQFERTVPTVYWQLGFDVGTEIYFARLGFFSLAIGYLHPVNGFATAQTTSTALSSAEFTTVFVDTWSFKLGVGI